MAALAGPCADASRLCHSSALVAAALDELSAQAAFAKHRLSELHTMLHRAIDSRIAELDSLLSAAVSSKSHALESQLVGIDGALERLQANHAQTEASMGCSHDGAVPETQPVVLPDICVEADTAQILDVLSSFGGIIAPPVVTARDVALVPPPVAARPGSTINLALRLGDNYPQQGKHGTVIALASLENALHIEAILLPPQEALLSGVEGAEHAVEAVLPALVSRDAARPGVVIALPIPPDAVVGSTVAIRRLHVAGRAVASDTIRIGIIKSRRFWRIRFIESSPTGWEAYLSNLVFHSPNGNPIAAQVVKCWSRVEIDTYDGVTKLHPEFALRRTTSHDGAYRTMYSPGMNGDFVAVELATAEDVSGVSFDQFAGAGNAVTIIALEGSVDGDDWLEILRSPVPHGARFHAAVAA